MCIYRKSETAPVPVEELVRDNDLAVQANNIVQVLTLLSLKYTRDVSEWNRFSNPAFEVRCAVCEGMAQHVAALENPNYLRKWRLNVIGCRIHHVRSSRLALTLAALSTLRRGNSNGFESNIKEIGLVNVGSPCPCVGGVR